MPIRIESIQLRNCGPIKDFSAEPASLNLIYGHNETGKTFLVEFLIMSLFRYGKRWHLREENGTGKISISGLTKKSITFNPNTKEKLEDFWEEGNTGLPLNLANLLVVKGADLSLQPEAAGGVDRNVLKSVLTRDSLLDQILSGIQPTVQKATLKKGVIQGDQRGLIKNWTEAKKEYKRLEKLTNEIHSNYSQGASRILELELEKLKSKLELQLEAQRHHAYQLEGKKAELELALNDLSDLKLKTLSEKLIQHQQLGHEINQLKENQSNYLRDSREYLWLKNAAEIWEKTHLQRLPKPNLLFPIVGLILLGLSLFTALVNRDTLAIGYPWSGIILAVLGLVALGLYLYRLQSWPDILITSQELTSLKEEFFQKFATRIQTLADLKERLDAQHESKILAEGLTRSLEEKRNLHKQLAGQITQIFAEFDTRSAEGESWQGILANLQNKRKNLVQQIHHLDKDIALLGVSEKDLLPQPPSVDYDPELITELTKQIEQFDNRLSAAYQELTNLKNHACRETGDDINLPWQVAFSNLIDLKQNKAAELKTLTAEIMASIGVTQVINKIQEEEDQKIQEDLASPQISQLLTTITGTYNRIKLVGDQLFVSDPYNDFPIQALSTGALDQVQLVLRMGLASKLSNGDPLFLLLDDAFQHADWKRREILVQQTIEMVKSGWQIFYLSMDDHIRDLFVKGGKSIIREQFHYYELE